MYEVVWIGNEYVLKVRGRIVANGTFLHCCNMRRTFEGLGVKAVAV